MKDRTHSIKKQTAKRKTGGKHGFTLIELIVTLCILAVLLAVSVFGLSRWRKHSNFVQCDEYARTIFLTMQEALADMDARGELDTFDSLVMEPVPLNYLTGGAGREIAYLSVNRNDHAAYLAGGEAGAWGGVDDSKKWLYDCLSAGLTDGAILSGSEGYYSSRANIIVEFDRTARSVYSVFYSAWAQSLTYEANGNTDGPRDVVSVNSLGNADSRSTEVRSGLCLGYYSVEDFPHVSNLSAKKLKINTLELVNDEELYLRFSGNVPYRIDSPAVNNPATYALDMYTGAGEFLCHILLDTHQVLFPDNSGSKGIAGLPVSFDSAQVGNSVPDASYSTMYFPVSVNGSEYRVILDAMLDGEALNNWENAPGIGGNFNGSLTDASTYSVLRLVKRGGASGEHPDLFVKVRPFQNAVSGTGELADYAPGVEKRSNQENSLYGAYAANAGVGSISLGKWRHLYNMRYYREEPGVTASEFTVRSTLDWNVGKLFLYGPSAAPGTVYLTPSVREDFPSIPIIKSTWTLTGQNASTTLANLKLGSYSVVKGSPAHNTASDLALILENSGMVKNLIFQSVTVRANAAAAEDGNTRSIASQEMPRLKRAAALCAINKGTLRSVRFGCGTGGPASTLTAAVTVEDGEPSGVALAAAVVTEEGKVENVATSYQNSEELTSAVTGLIAAGDQAKKAAPCDAALDAGIGGVIGYLTGTTSAKVGGPDVTIENGANVLGNLQTGGVVGCVRIRLAPSETVNASVAQLVGCGNKGLVLCSSSSVKDENLAAPYDPYGMFVGGVVGYAENAVIDACWDQPSRKPEYNWVNAKAALQRDCRGTYVGGIVGYLKDGILDGCETRSSGYVLGHDYVGGIAGGLNGSSEGVIQYTTTSKTTNACYVIGYNRVGGIVGSNTGNSVLQYCVNIGIVGGYGRDIGGIAGLNLGGPTETAVVRGCASYTWDYTNVRYQIAVEYWQVDGDNTGGLVGYNDWGLVEYGQIPDVLQKENTISAIVVGGSHVGGVIGLNGPHGDLCVSSQAIKVIGGRIYGFGDCVGGVIGANFSPKIFLENKTLDGAGLSFFLYEDDPDRPQEIVAQPYSVEGRDCVGGIIGANLSSGDALVLFRCDNSFGTVTGTSAVGGVIGYQQILSEAEGSALLEALLQQCGTDSGAKAQGAFLDRDSASSLISARKPSQAGAVLTMRGSSSGSSLNNMEVTAENYVGGVIGFHAEDSGLCLKNISNDGKVNAVQSEKPIRLSLAFPSVWDQEKQAVSDKGAFAGGLISCNTSLSRIDNCTNTGRVSVPMGVSVLGGIAGVNRGTIINCEITQSQGSADQAFLGGVAGLNYNGGVIKNCRVKDQTTVVGRSYVGGIAAINGEGSSIVDCAPAATVRAVGDCAGGVAAENSGVIRLNATVAAPGVSGSKYVGGIVGWQKGGSVSTDLTGQTDLIGAGTKISGNSFVGGLIGRASGGTLTAGTGQRLVNRGEVSAEAGSAGGIIGGIDQPMTIRHADNYGPVKTTAGTAGGIVSDTCAALPGQQMLISGCGSYASVTSYSGMAAGIAVANRTNAGIVECTVAPPAGRTILITCVSDEAGAVACSNEGTIRDCTVGLNSAGSYVRLSGGKACLGGVAGMNAQGAEIVHCTVWDSLQLDMPAVASAKASYVIGGVTGENKGSVSGCSVSKTFNGSQVQSKPASYTVNTNTAGFVTSVTAVGSTGFSNVRFLGGIAGRTSGDIFSCTYSGLIHEAIGGVGSAYGGIAGFNDGGRIADCRAAASILGVGLSSSSVSDTDEVKMTKDVSVGGVTGVNKGGVLERCYIGSDDEERYLFMTTGHMGGVAGYNDGTVRFCGIPLKEEKTWDELKEYLDGLDPDMNETAVGAGNWGGDTVPDLTPYLAETKRVAMVLSGSSQGNLGGLVGLNAGTSAVSECITGKLWTVYHDISNSDACAAGAIAYSRQDRPMVYMINQTSVYKNKYWVAAGIVCRNEVMTGDTWQISHCYNFGDITQVGSQDGNRLGGIVGCIKYCGGTVNDCHNYGNITAKYYSAGIVGGHYAPNANTTITVSNCTNHGRILATHSTDKRGAGGIYGEAVNGKATSEVVLYNCANYGDVTASPEGNAAGVFCYRGDSSKVKLYYCQNYGKLDGTARFAFAWTPPASYKYCMSIVDDDCSGWSAVNNTTALTLKGDNYILDGTCQLLDVPGSMAGKGPSTYLRFCYLNGEGKYGYTGDAGYQGVMTYSKPAADVLSTCAEATGFYWHNLKGQLSKPMAPTDVALTQNGAVFTASWKAAPNAFGYQFELVGTDGTVYGTTTVYNTLTASMILEDVPPETAVQARIRSINAVGMSDDAALSPEYVTKKMLKTPSIVVFSKLVDGTVKTYLRPDRDTWETYSAYAADGVDFTVTFTYNGTSGTFDQNDFTGAEPPTKEFVGYSGSNAIIAVMSAATSTPGYTDSREGNYLTTIWNVDGANGNVTLSINSLGSVSFQGSTAKELVVKAVIEGATSGSEIAVYRAELVAVDLRADGTEKEQVVSWKDVMVSNRGNKVNIAFDGLKEDLLLTSPGFDSRTLHIRAWLAESGKGKVYYYDPDAQPDETGSLLWTAAAAGRDRTNIYKQTGNLNVQLLPAPELMSNAETVGRLNENGTLDYEFRWDEALSGAKGFNYRFTVYSGGIDAENPAVLYPADGSYDTVTGNKRVVSTNDWTVDTVTVEVTRVGVSGTSVGLTSRREYQIRRRLAEISQPTVDLSGNRNEMLYNISWTQKEAPVNGDGVPLCVGYDVYARYRENGETGLLKLNASTVLNGESLQYRLTADLERFAGQTVSLYVVARAEENSALYVDSVAGEAMTVTLPTRLPPPVYTLSWDTTGWVSAPSAESPGVVRQEDYDVDALKLRASVQETERLSGNYLLGGFVFSELPQDLDLYTPGSLTAETGYELSEAVESGRWKGSDQPLSDEGPAVMTYNGTDYTVTLRSLGIETAGQKAVPFLRAATNTNISSWWAASCQIPYAIDLPRVMLTAPAAVASAGSLSSADGFEQFMAAEGLEPVASCQITDIFTGNVTEGQNLKLDLATLSWTASQQADSYALTLTGGNSRSYAISAEAGASGSFTLSCQDTTPQEFHVAGGGVEVRPSNITITAEAAAPGDGETVHIYLPLRSSDPTFLGLNGTAVGQFETDAGYMCSYALSMTGVLRADVTNHGGTFTVTYQLYVPMLNGSVTFDHDGATKSVRTTQTTFASAGLTAVVSREESLKQYVSSNEKKVDFKD